MGGSSNFIRFSKVGGRAPLSISGCLAVIALASGCQDDPSITTSNGSASGSQTGSGGAGASGVGGSGGDESSSSSSAGGAGGVGGAGGSGMGGSIGEPMLVSVPISDMGHDRLLGVTFDAKGNIYATGVAASSTDATADYSMVLARFLPSGVLDESFGTKGIVTRNVAVGTNGESARGIVVQSTGKIVIAGTVEHAGAADPRDRDIALVRFNTNGEIDTTFGTSGVAIINLSEGELVGTSYVTDSQWGLSVFKDDDLLVTGAQKAVGGTDTDFAVIRLTPDGALDSTFGTNGVTTLDINKQGASPRSATILADGSVVVAGYTRDADNVVSPVIFKLTGAGQFDTSFGVNGVFNEIVLGSVTENYGAVLQGTNFVTAGYGRDTSTESLDWVSLRVTSTGTRDTTYGMGGVARIDVAGFNDNARGILALPDDRVMLIGGGRPTEDNVDAMAAILTKDGQSDTSFAPLGWKLYDLGGASDAFAGIALSPSQKFVAIVGSKGVGMAAGNDDAALLLLPLGN